MKSYCVYILASRQRGALYVGVTSNIARRMQEHKMGLVDGFTKQYGTDRLVYVEQTTEVQSALQRDKRLKKWNRDWKVQLIEKNNPEWRDLCRDI